VTVGVAITGGAVLAPGGGPVPGDALPGELRERISRVERVSGLALAAGFGALGDAGITLEARRERAGVVLGTAFGCFLTNAEYQQRFAAGGVGAASPRLFAATVSNAAAGEVSIALGLAGPGITLTAGCVSGTLALGHAAALAAAGDADVVLAGGVDAMGRALTAFLDAGGLAVGGPIDEAAALVVLEPLAAARQRGARVRGVVLGHGAGFEPDPAAADDAGDGLAHAMRTALSFAETVVTAVAVAAPPVTRGFVERAVRRVLGEAGIRRLAFEDAVGHSLGAAGPRTVLRVLESEAPGTPVLIVDACASGHVAALVVGVGAGT
jgi:3-oxoacyl-(acyl-carrier-protein) synthase